MFHGRTYPPGRHAYLEQAVALATAGRPGRALSPGASAVVAQASRSVDRDGGGHGEDALPARPSRPEPDEPPPRRPALVACRAGERRARRPPAHGLDASAARPQRPSLLRRGCARAPPRPQRPPRMGVGAAYRARRSASRRPTGRQLALVTPAPDAPARAALCRGRAASRRRASAKSCASAGEPLVVAGDFNLTAGSPAVRELTERRLLRARAWPSTTSSCAAHRRRALVVWPEERRRVDGRLLSDHPPVELSLEL